MVKKALLVGINDYHSISDLRGCLNDIKNVRDILKTFYGFTNNDIRVVTDDRATEENVQSRLEWMVEGAKAGDQLFFHFSGHGSQIRDRDGDELRDNKDEILCMYGMSWDKGYISDDWFDDLFAKVPQGVTFELIFDSCHSGTDGEIKLTEDVATPGSRVLGVSEPGVVGRFLPPPVDIEMRSEGEELPVKRLALASFANNPFKQGGTATDGFVPPKITIWSGCGESQTSADAYIGGDYNGAFSFYWCKHVREAGGHINREALIRKVQTSLRTNKYTQIPEVTSNYSGKLLLS
jgi:metacaspase-1